MQRRKSVSNAIEHTIAEITEQIRHKQNDKRNSILIHLNDSTYQTISYILCGIFIAIFICIIAILIWSVVLSKEDNKLFDSINKSLLQELDDNNE